MIQKNSYDGLDPFVCPSGPTPAKYLIVGEAPGESEVAQHLPFVGVSGQELTSMLADAGIDRAQCRITNVCQQRPPKNDIELFLETSKSKAKVKNLPNFRFGRFFGAEIAAGLEALRKEIALTQPKVILAFGDVALWALTGHSGIMSWRGSILNLAEDIKSPDFKKSPLSPVVIPTVHPALILRMWEWRGCAIHDLRRAVGGNFTRPQTRFRIRPSFSEAISTLKFLKGKTFACDIETLAHNVACIGFAYSSLDAICIPFVDVENKHYFSEYEETYIVQELSETLRNSKVIGQNFAYDAQHLAFSFGIDIPLFFDTMLAHHVLYPGLPKSLAYMSSLYCAWHRYWKDDLDDYHKAPDDFPKFWTYNCQDCVATFEVFEVLKDLLEKENLLEQFQAQMSIARRVLLCMRRGVRINMSQRNKLGGELLEKISLLDSAIQGILPGFKASSSQQIRNLFYEDLGVSPVRNRKTLRPSGNEESLQKISVNYPEFKPLIDLFLARRSLGVFLSTFCRMPLDSDLRMRTSFNVAGTETFRFSSSANAFGTGGNLQNLPKGSDTAFNDPFQLIGTTLPNIRKLYIPDPGFVICDADLSRADVQVVAWEAGDSNLKKIFHDNIDLHGENAKILGCPRPLAKAFVHATNYGATVPTLAQACRISRSVAQKMHDAWFEAHPGIKAWHQIIEDSIMRTRMVKNKFGYRRVYFDRIEGILPQALAWIPQSTVALYINRIWAAWEDTDPNIEILLQCHDSLVFQYKRDVLAGAEDRLRKIASSISIPYDDPLIIPLTFKWSQRSWGDAG